MKAIHKRRLLKLAKHLKHGKLGHKKFDFGTYNNVSVAKCGTAGCALGECPILWPRYWKFTTTGVTRPQFQDSFFSEGDSAKEWFGLSEEESNHLFYPRGQQPEKFGGAGELPGSATRKQVAANMVAFIKKKEKEKSK